jgi:hypothetical protein
MAKIREARGKKGVKNQENCIVSARLEAVQELKLLAT